MAKLDNMRPYYATTYGAGPFHPAIHMNGRVFYWPNVTFETEMEAYERACMSLADVITAANSVVEQWNIYPA